MPGSLRQPQLDPRLKSFLIWAVLLLTGSSVFLGYWGYSRSEHADPVSWQQLAHGQGPAPAQYRIGVYFTANAVARVTHWHFRHIFAASDLVSTALALAALFFMLTRSQAFRETTVDGRWVMAVFALLLVQFYLPWTLWFQQPETLPSLAILAASSLLCSGYLRVPRPLLAVSLILVALLGSTIRVDEVVAFHAGMLAAACLTSTMPLGRGWQIATSLAALALALGIEQWLAHTVFSSAAREVALLQLDMNFRAWNNLLVLAVTLPAWVWTVGLALRRWRALDGWARGLVLGSLVHFMLFIAFGMADEIRIFVPFILTLLPISASLLPRAMRAVPEAA